MITSCPLGTSGFECSFVIYLVPALLVLGALLFRKNIANDIIGWDFSIIGSSIAGVLIYFIIYAIFKSFKFSLLGGIIGMIAAGFLLAPLIGDGDSE